MSIYAYFYLYYCYFARHHYHKTNTSRGKCLDCYKMWFIYQLLFLTNFLILFTLTKHYTFKLRRKNRAILNLLNIFIKYNKLHIFQPKIPLKWKCDVFIILCNRWFLFCWNSYSLFFTLLKFIFKREIL